MQLNYNMLLQKISDDQGLGLSADEIPLIINTDLTTYIQAFITYEDDEYIVIVVPDENGAEYAKIINKSTVVSIEIIYMQMLEVKDTEGGVMYR